MTATPYLPAIDSIHIDAVLSDAIVLNWSDLMPELTSGLIHIEYHVEPLGSVEYMKVWASTIRGSWSLICEHWMRWDDSHQVGSTSEMATRRTHWRECWTRSCSTRRYF